MAKNNTAVSEAQISQDNPLVLIKYAPENAPLVLATNATKTLTKLQSLKSITNVKQMEAASSLISDAEITAEEVETFVDSLRGRIQEACGFVRQFAGYEDFEATLTIRKWGLRQLLSDGIRALKNERARFLDAEARKVREAQIEAENKQRRINEKAATDAAAAAKAAGADKATVAEIKKEVLATPAPVVQSKAMDAAKLAGASLRYHYTAEITDLRKFLQLCLQNEIMFNTLTAAKSDIEAVFGKMAQAQKEAFAYQGISYKKTPVDVSRGR